ncbi:hypothetical protein CC77DRAFT_1098047 [Alternaria alternata]|uniref:Arrestin-like N-terminal domain-containing protein n=1 Tax=Alternaria alternata TaxID=5599 RepID=A0A177DC19_ALTAL|nr:hypothetical protein CC77DRAFT_1098047 [Alternaria alternata]OAG17026.1 hypothetical protein CC77DRAFT_1098047 [Alternaria alternata]
MDTSIQLDHPKAIFSNGDPITGNIVIYCPTSITKVSKITATLVGESVLSYTDTSGLLMDREQQDKYRFAHDFQVIFPSRHDQRVLGAEKSVRLGFGYHSFRFALRIPDAVECSSCPPNSPAVSPVCNEKYAVQSPSSSHDMLPPSMHDIVDGAAISYRIDVAVTSIRSIFKSTIKTNLNITVWPMETHNQYLGSLSKENSTFPCVKTVQATIMGPYAQLPALVVSPTEYMHHLSAAIPPAQISISAHLLPDYSILRNRHMMIRLSISKLNEFAYSLYLQSFQMLLVGYTDIKAKGPSLTNTQISCWTIQSMSNLGLPVLHYSESVGTEKYIDRSLWEGEALPDTIVPSFDSCGLARRYELDISMGFQCRDTKDQAGRILLVQLRTPVHVSSGIRPGRKLESGDDKKLFLNGELVPISMRSQDDMGTQDENRHGATQRVGAANEDYGTPMDPPPTYEEATIRSW